MEKILILHPTLGIGGAEKIISYVANTLSEKYKIHIILLRKYEHVAQINDKIIIEENELYSTDPIIGKHLASGLKKFMKMTRGIRNILHEEEPDLVLCFNLRVLVSLYLANIGEKRKILFSERADPNEHSRLWKWILSYIYTRITGVVFQTKGAYDCYNFIKRKCNYAIIENPAITCGNHKEYECFDFDGKYIFSAGRMQHRKGFDLLVDAYAMLIKELPEYKLVLFGNGYQEEDLQRRIHELHLGNSVIMMEPTPNVIEKNRNASLFVLSSRSEGIPNILIEAIMNHIPCVACDCRPGGARLLLNEGKNGWLAKNEDVNDLKEKMYLALTDVEQTASFVKDSYIYMENFSENKIGDKWKHTVKKAIQGRGLNEQ